MLFLYTNIHYKNSDGSETVDVFRQIWHGNIPENMLNVNVDAMAKVTQALCEKEAAEHDLPNIVFPNLTIVINEGYKCIGGFNLLHSNKQAVITVSSVIKNF